jgi:uncharacterized protein (TIGR03435 family)
MASIPFRAFSQSTPATAPPAFEVASVKPNKSGARRSGVKTDPAKLTGTNATLKQLILYAYDLPGYRVSGQGWIETERYDVRAKAESPASKEQIRLMLQTLLADRFKLKFHHETKVLPVYWLVVAKGGFKAPGVKEGESLLKDGPPALKPGANVIFLMQQSDLPGFAEGLSRMAGRPVLDKTGINGQFVFYLEWTSEASLPGSASTPDGPSPPADSGPSIFAALQQKFGLRLEASRAPIEILVIDHVEKPTEN